MKKILINGSHTEKLTAALEEIQSRCTARTLTVSDIEWNLDKVTKELGIPKKAMTGVKLHYTGAQQFPNAYNGLPESTHFRAEFNGRVWVITEIFRTTCPDRINNTSVELSESAKEALLARFSTFRV